MTNLEALSAMRVSGLCTAAAESLRMATNMPAPNARERHALVELEQIRRRLNQIAGEHAAIAIEGISK